MRGRVEALCYAPRKGGPLATVTTVEVVAGAGIVGDHFFGAKQRYPGQNITLVEAEEIEQFAEAHGASLPLTATRRNIVTRDVRLDELVGREFAIGDVQLRGVELCEPCTVLARHLASLGIPARRLIRLLTHRAGLRADVVTSGTIRVGAPILRHIA